jgi:phage shock protein PspC (stress-responsive transcriptional regulator)
MKKVININFQGRVIPIEEAAYDILKGYTDSLRKYFAREEGRDEIINDIENRIAELFSEDLKKNPAGCITEDDVQRVIGSIGRPEDFDGGEVSSSAPERAGTDSYSAAQDHQGASFYRDMNDKILGGVCSGLAHRLNIDPTIVRVIFAIVTLGGFGTGFLLYILLWIILPKKGFDGVPARRRIYRNPDQKVIGGVASGLASYFNIAVWIPRLIFALPLVAGILNSMFRTAWWWDGDHDLPHFVFNGFGGTLFLTYIILWIVIPQAKTASEKLEMRGEKVDLESIKNSVQEELKDVKGRAEKFGQEFGQKVEAWGEEVNDWGKRAGESSKSFATEVAPAARNAGNGIGHAIGVIFKAFFLFIAGIIIFALFMTLMAVLLSGGIVYGLKDYVLDGFWQNLMAFNSIALMLGIPIIAAAVWLIRRISGVRSTNSYLGWIFGSLWTIGLISFILLTSQLSREFKRRGSANEEVALTRPANGRMLVDVKPVDGKFYNLEWFDDDDFDNTKFPALTASEDSMLLNTVRIKLIPSKDSAYHAYLTKFARASDPVKAETKAGGISFPIEQRDSLLLLPAGFAISKQTKFRNQQVLVVIEVPVGKQVRIDHSTERYDWFNVGSNSGRGRGLVIEWDEDWDRDNNYKTDVWYTMTATGLERADGKSDWNSDEEEGDRKGDNDGYRYRRGKNINIDSINREIELKSRDTTINIKLNAESIKPEEPADAEGTVTANNRQRIRNYTPLISVFNLMKLVR